MHLRQCKARDMEASADRIRRGVLDNRRDMRRYPEQQASCIRVMRYAALTCRPQHDPPVAAEA